MLELSRISFLKTLLTGPEKLPAFIHRQQLELVTIFLSATIKLPVEEPSEYNDELLLSSHTKIDFQDSQLTSSTLTGVVSRIPSFFGWMCPEVHYKIRITLYSMAATIDSSYHFKTRNRFCDVYFRIFMLKTVKDMIENFSIKTETST